MSISSFAPVSGWKQWAGLIVIVVVVAALSVKFGTQAKVVKLAGGNS